MNKREEKLFEALHNDRTRDLVMERLWPHASVVDNSWTRNVAWVKKGKKFLDTKLELGGIGELSVIVGFKGFYGQNYEVRSEFTSEEVWRYCADLLETKEERLDKFIANGVNGVESMYANAVYEKSGAERAALKKNKEDALEVMAKLGKILKAHLVEWEE